ncbi:MAG: hypothetical protein WBY44_24385 [Bryobacteraceae bacterium]
MDPIAARELRVHVEALSYLVTLLVQRMYEKEPVWCQELLEGIRSDRNATAPPAAQAGFVDDVFRKSISIPERAMQ